MNSDQSEKRPKVGFLGVGWIGRHRMEAALATGAIEAAAISDPSDAMVADALKLAPDAAVAGGLDDMLGMGLDGIVIATPSALHAAQSVAALQAGVAVFCQKPLGRSAAEVRGVVDAARRADKLLGVDFSYRFTEGMVRIRDLVAGGALGPVHAVDLTFHNAYGPDKPWFYDPAQSGGGCMMDLGVHLIDLALWCLDFPNVERVDGALFAKGAPLADHATQVEDYAVATVRLAGGAVVRIACSWNLHAGRDAAIAAEFYGPQGGAALRNVGGSFFDFTAERFSGTVAEILASPPDAWGGRAIADWARRLGAGERFSPEAERFIQAHEVLDRVYAGRG